MPLRLWALAGALFLAIGIGAGLALFVGVEEVRLHRAGPRKRLLAEEVRKETAGLVQVLGCARHDLEVAVSSDGILVAGERDPQDRLYIPLTPQSECDDETPQEDGATIHVYGLIEARDSLNRGLGRLYGQGYKAPPTKVILDGAIGFGGNDGRAERVARAALGLKKDEKGRPTVPGAPDLPLLVKDRRPGSLAAAYATIAVGVHGLLLVVALFVLALRRSLRGGLPAGFAESD